MNDSLQFSESRLKIAKALMVMQKNMGPVIKAATNPHFKSKYADLPAVVEAVTDALEAAGLVFLQGSSTDSVDGNTVVRVQTTLLHDSGEWVSTCLGLPIAKSDPQGVGSAITYGRRYGLQLLCGIAPEDDDGNLASRPAQQPAAVHRPVDVQKGNGSKPIPTRGDLEHLANLADVNLVSFIKENIKADYEPGGKLTGAELIRVGELLRSLAEKEIPF